MGRQIDKIKQKELMTGPEILAGLIWDRAINAKSRFFKVPYYQFPCYIEYCHEHEGDGFRIDCLYLKQEHSFMLVQPKYKDVLSIAPQILDWLEATYAMCCPPEPPRPKLGKRNNVSNRQQIANSLLNIRRGNNMMRKNAR